jgi:dihydrofolate reductase
MIVARYGKVDPMSKLVLKMSTSFDGFATSTDGTHEWMFPTFSDDAGDWTIACMEETAAHLMGSTTYHAMAGHWPESDSRFAPYMNQLPKIVFSNSLTSADWDKTRIVSGDLAEGIVALKAEYGPQGILMAHGGPTFAKSLVATGLVDEYRILVHPVVIGEGRSLFPAKMDFDIVHVEPFSSGAVAYTMRPAAETA